MLRKILIVQNKETLKYLLRGITFNIIGSSTVVWMSVLFCCLGNSPMFINHRLFLAPDRFQRMANDVHSMLKYSTTKGLVSAMVIDIDIPFFIYLFRHRLYFYSFFYLIVLTAVDKNDPHLTAL